VSKDFFVQFGQKTWLSPYSVVSELVEDSFDEDSTRVIVTVGGDCVVVEDDAGMDEQRVQRFLTVGSIHKQFEPLSPKFRRARTGRFGAINPKKILENLRELLILREPFFEVWLKEASSNHGVLKALID
jgi:hypothetical protein